LNRGFRSGLFGVVALLIMSTAVPTAQAATKERVSLTIPVQGQLSIARLEFKTPGVAKPKLKVTAKNVDELPDSLVAAAQTARFEDKKRRAVAFVAMANRAPPGSMAHGARETRSPQQIEIEVRFAQPSRKFREKFGLDIDFVDDPNKSRNFLSPLGFDPPDERQLAQLVFALSGEEFPDDEYGALDLFEALQIMGLQPFRQATFIAIANQAIVELTAYELMRSAIAAAVGPPAALDAGVYTYVTRRQAPVKLEFTASPSPSNPSVVFSRVSYDAQVMGAQVSQASDNTVLHTADARCQNGFLQNGVVTWGPGPVIPGVMSPTYRLDCDLPQDNPTVFFDISMQRPPDPGARLFKFLPIPFYGDDQLGEAVGSEQSTFFPVF
jgi:hypothetical protein